MTTIAVLTTDNRTKLDELMREHFGPSIDTTDDDAPLWQSHDEAPTAGMSPALRAAAGTPEFDSLDKVEFMMSVEDEFAITITDAMASSIRTKGDIVTYLATVLADRGADAN